MSKKEEQLAYFAELLGQLSTWMASIERRIDSLEPVALDIQIIEDQIESLQVAYLSVVSYVVVQAMLTTQSSYVCDLSCSHCLTNTMTMQAKWTR